MLSAEGDLCQVRCGCRGEILFFRPHPLPKGLTCTRCICFMLLHQNVMFLYDSCHEKINLFGVHNWVLHYLAWWIGSQVSQPEKLFSP